MNMRIARIITLAAILGAPTVWGQNEMKNIEALKTGALAQRSEAIKALLQTRQDIISALLPIMDGNVSADIKRDVAKVLGEYRAVEAVDPLVRNLELELQPRILKGLIKQIDLYPISQALSKIGKPAIPALLAKIAETDNSALIHRCAQVCVDIEGREVAELVMNRHWEKAPTSEAKQRLKQALDAMQKVK